MIRSMTGFGRGVINTEIGEINVEIKSVNGKTCVVNVKLPEALSPLEGKVAAYVRNKARRGQINVTVALNRDGVASGKRVIIDKQLVKEYWDHLIEIKEFLSLPDNLGLGTISILPGVITVEEPKENIEGIWPAMENVLAIALDQLIEIRRAEGTAIFDDLMRRLESISHGVERISLRTPKVLEEYQERLRKRIVELMQGQFAMDDSRVVMEIAILAERSDVTEEIVRLRSHISQMIDNLRSPEEPIGRHLDFVFQEMNREINTVASKSSDFQITTECIKIKDEIEKMREQAQNVE